MGYIVKCGSQIGRDYLPKVMELDGLVYESQYVGELANMENRYDANPESFVCIIDEENDVLAGYINFFPCTEELYQSIRYDSQVIRDDDIAGNEIAEYSSNDNHIFILSVVVHPQYRDKGVVLLLTDAWIDYLNCLSEKGFPVTDIMATAVSEDGMKYLRNRMFIQDRKLEDGNILYICEDRYLEKLLAKELYHKTYRDDIYLMLPLAEHKKNWRTNELFERDADMDDIPQALIDGLQECFEYECSNEMLADLETVYLGKYSMLHTTDDYDTCGREVIVGEEIVYAIITAHKITHMFNLTIMIPDCKYSTTQVEDQLSYGFIKIRDPRDESKFVDIYEYLHDEFGLFKCGDGKCLLYMSNKPKIEGEFQNILSGEVFNSMHINYHIHSEQVEKMCNTNYSQYDYYDVFLSDKVIAFIAKEFDDDVLERIAVASTYAFIVQLVVFQNTSLAKNNIKISRALAQDGDISHEQILELYQDFGKTMCFWELNNYKYRGTQNEATCITEAFANKELKVTYNEYQEYLEHIVELKSARTEARNGTILNIVMTLLAIIQVQTFVVDLLAGMYEKIGIDVRYAESTFMTAMVCGSVTVFLLYMIVKKRNARMRKRKMKIR